MRSHDRPSTSAESNPSNFDPNICALTGISISMNCSDLNRFVALATVGYLLLDLRKADLGNVLGRLSAGERDVGESPTDRFTLKPRREAHASANKPLDH